MRYELESFFRSDKKFWVKKTTLRCLSSTQLDSVRRSAHWSNRVYRIRVTRMSTNETLPAILDSPQSLSALAPAALVHAIEKHRAASPDYFNKDEATLYKYLRSQEETPSPTDNRLRLKFWIEFERAQEHGGKMSLASIVNGVCYADYFTRKFLEFPSKVAWLVCPPAGYALKTEEALEFGIEQLRDILSIPHLSTTGRFDDKLAGMKLKIVMMLDQRVKGALVQKTLALNVHTSNKDVARAVTAQNMEELQKQLKELERRNRAAKNLPLTPDEAKAEGKLVIEVEPT